MIIVYCNGDRHMLRPRIMPLHLDGKVNASTELTQIKARRASGSQAASDLERREGDEQFNPCRLARIGRVGLSSVSGRPARSYAPEDYDPRWRGDPHMMRPSGDDPRAVGRLTSRHELQLSTAVDSSGELDILEQSGHVPVQRLA
jgi:hypothetical protein